MKMMDFLEFYPDNIERIANICENALEEAKFTDKEIDEIFDGIKDAIDLCFKQGDVTRPMDIIIDAIARETVLTLSDRFRKEEFDYDNNGAYSCLYVNKQQYTGGDIIPFFEHEYPQIPFDDGEIKLSNASVIQTRFDTMASYDVKFNNEVLDAILDRCGLDTHDQYDSIDVTLHRDSKTIDSISLALKDKQSVGKNDDYDFYDVPLFADEKDTLLFLTNENYKKDIDNAKLIANKSKETQADR